MPPLPATNPFSIQAIAPYAESANADDTSASPILQPSPTTHGEGILPYLALAGGTAADTLSTIDSIHRGNVEANPIFGGSNPTAIAAIKGLTAVPEAIAIHALAKSGHPTAAKTLGLIIGGLGGALGAYNSQVGKK